VKRLIVWRHGETEWNATGRVQGHADVGLTALGRNQAREAAKRLAELRPVAIVSSDLSRAADTAAMLAEFAGCEIRYDSRLRERCYGPWQGCAVAEIAERWPREYARWRAGERALGLGIETLDEVAIRAAAGLADALFTTYPKDSGHSPEEGGLPQDAASVVPEGAVVVAVTHGGAARAGCGQLLGWSTTAARAMAVLGNCRWTELHHQASRGWQLWSHNS
jgi:probable phosphoglycerate mutase